MQWTKDEIRMLSELYPLTDTADVSDRLHRSEQAVRKMAHSGRDCAGNTQADRSYTGNS